MASIIETFGAIRVAVAQAIAVPKPSGHAPPRFVRSFTFVSTDSPWRASGGQCGPVIPGLDPGFAFAADHSVHTADDIAQGNTIAPGPYTFTASLPLTDAAGTSPATVLGTEVNAAPGILNVELAPTVSPDLAFTVPEIHASTADLAPTHPTIKGSGVVIGIIDYGFDFAHPNFLKKDPTTGEWKTRLLALWDQNNVGLGNTGVMTALNTLRPGGGGSWSLPNINRSYIYSPDKPFLGWNGARDSINDQLKNNFADPYTNYYDPHDNYFAGTPIANEYGAHGTHVADIAAGNGEATGKPGVAPDADIIFVQLRPPTVADGPADPVAVLDGVHFIAKYAATLGKRAVINICVNANSNVHNAAYPQVLAFDRYAQGNFLTVMQPTPIVVAAGNQFLLSRPPINLKLDPAAPPSNWKRKYRETLAQRLDMTDANGHTFYWLLNQADKTLSSLEIWFQYTTGTDDPLTVDVTSRLLTAANQPPPTVASPNSVTTNLLEPGGTLVGTISRDALGPTGPRVIRMSLDPTKLPWVDAKDKAVLVAIKVTSSVMPKRAHVWVERDGVNLDNQSSIAISTKGLTDSELAGELAKACSLGLLACGSKTISVGAYFAADRSGKAAEIAQFSSSGPTVNFATLDAAPETNVDLQPWISAPGVTVLAARSKGGRNIGSGPVLPYSVVMSGTSMAAPHVSGTVGLLLQQRPAAINDDVRGALRETARHEPPPYDAPKLWPYDLTKLWHKRLGYGRLDALAALKKI